MIDNKEPTKAQMEVAIEMAEHPEKKSKIATILKKVLPVKQWKKRKKKLVTSKKSRIKNR